MDAVSPETADAPLLAAAGYAAYGARLERRDTAA
jgi:hypothetical protein